MKIGILTSGGDCPGLNAVIRGIVLKARPHTTSSSSAIRDGWRGLVDGDFMPLTRHEVKGLSKVGGTILGTSRTNPYEGERGGADNIAKTLYGHKIDGIIAIGGEGTLAAADRLAKDGIKVIGVPKTIDNDLQATDYSFGFDTAVNIATDAMDRLRTTGDSHQRCMVAEVMGRHVGWIALHAGMAAGAHVVCIPEVPMSIDEITELVTSAHDRGRAPLVVVSEGFKLLGMDEAYSDKGLDAFNRPPPRRPSATCSRPRSSASPARDAGDDPRSHPARRIALGVRPRARDTTRSARCRRDRRRRLGPDGRHAGHGYRPGAVRRCTGRTEHGPALPLRRGGGALRLSRLRLSPPLAGRAQPQRFTPRRGRACPAARRVRTPAPSRSCSARSPHRVRRPSRT